MVQKQYINLFLSKITHGWQAFNLKVCDKADPHCFFFQKTKAFKWLSNPLEDLKFLKSEDQFEKERTRQKRVQKLGGGKGWRATQLRMTFQRSCFRKICSFNINSINSSVRGVTLVTCGINGATSKSIYLLTMITITTSYVLYLV